MRILYLAATVVAAGSGSMAAAGIGGGSHPLDGSIREIAVQADNRRTSVILTGDGVASSYATQILADPARILVDIACRSDMFATLSMPVSGTQIKNIRIGHHPRKIRMVLDLRERTVPFVTTAQHQDTLIISMDPRRPEVVRESSPTTTALQTTRAMPVVSTQAAGGAAEVERTATKAAAVRIKQTVRGISVQSEPAEPQREKRPADPEPLVRHSRSSEALTRVDSDDGKPETQKFLACIYAYESQNWPEATRHLQELIQTFPGGRYEEKAYFLQAEAFARMHADRISERYNELKRAYEDAIYRYPRSVYISDAEVSLGKLNFAAGNYFEALGYYNLVIEKDRDAAAVLDALMQKARILSLTQKKKETLPIYETVIKRYPGTLEEVQAKIELAELHFEMNSFHRSLDILKQLGDQLDDMNRYPKIFRCFGNNYYQLRQFAPARSNLIKYYNLQPEDEENHLTLARIADCYRESGLAQKATRFYKLVLDRYPNTEGALISMYRLAELQERGEISVEPEKVVPGVEVADREISMPRKIYEDVIRNALKKDENSPLIQFALLKLSIIAQKEKDYEKSLKLLKGLLHKYPHTTLKKEIEHTLREILVPLLEKDLKVKKYKNLINVYQAEGEMLDRLASPEIFLAIARAALELNLEDLAVTLFRKADPLMSPDQKPPELLYYLGRDFFDQDRRIQALAYFDSVLQETSAEKFHAQTFLLKGKILMADKKYAEASSAFSAAVEANRKRCAQPELFGYKARALIAMQSTDAAYRAIAEADSRSRSCDGSDYRTFEEIGELYLQVGQPHKALASIQFALDRETDEGIQTRLKIFMARCYERLQKESAYLAIYNEIIGRNDPFWSRVAREKIEEAQFKGVMGSRQK